MEIDFDKSKTLTELESDDWGESDFSTALVRRCHALRYKPVGELELDEMITLLGQNIGNEFLVPLALALLQEDPILEGFYYHGDLLSKVMTLENDFYEANPETTQFISDLIPRAERALKLLDNEISTKVFEEARAQFVIRSTT